MHLDTFEHLKPTDTQLARMATVRQEVQNFAATLEALIPDGADKTYLLRKLREVAMWANIAITRWEDGRPRA
jgi:hypothetical protein